jgi:protocatechuate 4,5-dioxygenase beta chain
MFVPRDLLPKVYAAIPEYTKQSQPEQVKAETSEVLAGYMSRVDAAFAELRTQLQAFRPDALIVVGDDEHEMFGEACTPAISVFTGLEVWGSAAPSYIDQPPEASRIHMPVHSELAKLVLQGLMRRGFDPANSSVMKPFGRPERGASHMLVFPAQKIFYGLEIPIIPVFLNVQYPPMPSGRRCWELGVALADIFAGRPERIAIYASGGLSHDPFGPRAGWIDEPLDRWILERIEQDRGEELTSLFSFDSDTLRGGTGEVRSWITAAGACRWGAKVVDYIPVHHTKTGLAFAYWPARNQNTEVRRGVC